VCGDKNLGSTRPYNVELWQLAVETFDNGQMTVDTSSQIANVLGNAEKMNA
jgi:hypothetical protein